MSVIISCHRSPHKKTEKIKMGFNIAVGQLMIGKVPRENNNPLEENGLMILKRKKKQLRSVNRPTQKSF
jgi:hypothetical protein